MRDLTRAERLFQLRAPGIESQFPPLRTLDSYAGNLPTQLTSFEQAITCEQQDASRQVLQAMSELCKPHIIPGHDPTEAGTVTCPDWYGGTNFMSPSFDKSRGLFFVTVRETCVHATSFR